jgi:serine/threonine-protein kinase
VVPAGGEAAAPAVAPLSDSGKVPAWLLATLKSSLGVRYRDFMVLGAGGMGTVVKAFDSRLERVVAIKVPPPHLASVSQFQVRFLREARAVARLDHPNIGRVIDVPEVPDGEAPVMILEFLDGVNLETYLDRRGKPGIELALRWVHQAGTGIQHAHEQGILHRDIKPANLMLVKDAVKVLDFGLAALEDRKGLTEGGMLLGSIPYMSPQQLQREQVGVEGDVYALGVTAFQLLTGGLPFEAGDSARERIPKISQACTGAPEILDVWVARSLAPDVRNRFQSVKAMMLALRAFASRRGSQA